MQFSFIEYVGDSLATAFEKRISRIFNGSRSKLSPRSFNLPFGFSFSSFNMFANRLELNAEQFHPFSGLNDFLGKLLGKQTVYVETLYILFFTAISFKIFLNEVEF